MSEESAENAVFIKQKILISACLLGAEVTYDGGSNFLAHPLLVQWQKEGRLVSGCPEVAGGLPIPRPAAQISGIGGAAGVFDQTAHVLKKNGGDVTAYFVRGANEMLALAKKHNIKLAIMKEGSPSCGSHEISDGAFSGRRISGNGVTVELLRKNGVTVFSENEIAKVESFLNKLEQGNG